MFTNQRKFTELKTKEKKKPSSAKKKPAKKTIKPKKTAKTTKKPAPTAGEALRKLNDDTPRQATRVQRVYFHQAVHFRHWQGMNNYNTLNPELPEHKFLVITLTNRGVKVVNTREKKNNTVLVFDSNIQYVHLMTGEQK